MLFTGDGQVRVRGFGDSDKPATGYDKRTVADDIYRLVRQLGFERIFLVGHDIGGLVAYIYAEAHREAVRRFVFIESLIPGVGYESLVANSNTWHHRFILNRDLAEAMVAGRERLFLSWFYHQDAYNPTAIDERDIDEYVRSYAAPGGLRSTFEYYRTMAQDAIDNQDAIKTKLTMPVLAVGGDRQIGHLVAQEMQRVAENVEEVIISDCKHWVAEEHPEKLVQTLLTFFSSEDS